MLSWSIAKSAEAMFSRWAIKRVCKFLLKKKLGKFILGDIDLNQLDVQLTAGTIQLSDLAFNVDYINLKLGTAPIVVKEGSIGSLVVSMPWKDGGCRIDIDELELVLAPRRSDLFHSVFETASNGEKGDSRKVENERMNSGVTNASVDVHEGVKTVAKMVKWLLTSFNVKVKKLIVAFDPLVEEGSENVGLDRILVLRISEAECGTHIFEDAPVNSFTAAHNFLGLSRLTNFVKFQGAVLELLRIEGSGHQPRSEDSSGTLPQNLCSGYCSSRNVATIIAGEKGGFSGNLKLSIPWKNGSLDIRRVDADLHVEPLELSLQPSTIRFFISMWDLFNTLSQKREDICCLGPSNVSSDPILCTHTPEKEILGNEGFVSDYSFLKKESGNYLLSDSHLISDWVSRNQNIKNEEEPDFGASVDQFFECFDGLRNSQSALGNSGVWNWTSSVFTAITAASNLASGSLHVPAEQQHVETKFNATIARSSVLLSFIDEEQEESLRMEDERLNSDVYVHTVCAQFSNLFLAFQVRPEEMDFEVNVHHIQLVDHMSSKKDSAFSKKNDSSGTSESDIALIWQMQDGVQGALQSFQLSRIDLDQFDCPVNISLTTHENNSKCSHMKSVQDSRGKDATITLFKTSGVSQCHVIVKSGSSGGSSRTSLSLKLPPFVCWVNFDLITMTLEFLNEMANFIETTCIDSGNTPHSDDRGNITRSMDMPAQRILDISIFLPNVRMILCFPLKEREILSSYSSCNQFIAFDLFSPAIGGKNILSAMETPTTSYNKRRDVSASHSLHLNLGNFYLFAIRADSTTETGFSVEEIVSAVNANSYFSLISMFWRDDTTTGPWIAKKAKMLASSESARSEDKVGGNNYEFASVTTIKDVTDFDAHTRQEILSSSAFLLHATLPPVTINLSKSQYNNLCDLVNSSLDHFRSVLPDSSSKRKRDSASQASILVECDSVMVSVAVELVGDVDCSMLKELPGSWRSVTLQVNCFELLSVSNIGGANNSNFVSLSHRQGSLWGSITEGLNREFLLISCNDSTMGRGDGKGSNVLSSRFSGSNILNFWDPEGNHNFTSVTVKCATLVAPGGRLDWFNTIFSFFSPPSTELERPGNDNLEKTCGSSFVLNLVDVGLSYEPYSNEDTEEIPVACLLAASSLKLTNVAVGDCTMEEYKIKFQDLGLLISESKLVGGTYNVDHLRKSGYVKIAQETHVEALLKTKCDNGHAWELECAESQITLSTCHDTTLGLMRLAGRLQKLFAPDMQDYALHLENRWNHVQQVHNTTDELSDTQMHNSSLDNRSKIGSLMDEICEDVFQLDGNGNSDYQSKYFESCIDALSSDSSLSASRSSLLDENSPEFIEEYFLSDLRPLSGLALGSGVGEVRTGNGGWYGTNSLKILENHASKVNKKDIVQKLVVADEASTSDSACIYDGKAEGCIHLKNMNLIWRMYGGSDWSIVQNSCGRDATACLELAFSGIEVDYDLYPEGEMRASMLSLSVRDFRVSDKSAHAPWKLMLGYHDSKKHPRNSTSNAVQIIMKSVKPDPSIPLEENRLRISLQPIRLHLHQSQLDFLISFFGGKPSSPDPASGTPLSSTKTGESSDDTNDLSICEEAFLTYFQKFDISPLVIRVDYSPCRVDLTALRGGKYVELVNLVPWKGIELQLKHVQGVGLYGWNSIFESVLGEWLEDISHNQIHKLLKGLPPIKSLVAVGSGAAKLVSLPLKNYKKDRRLLKGMQRGTIAFLRSISLEAIELGVHLAAGAHDILLQAEYILTSIPPSVPWPVESSSATNVRSNQPSGAQQGIQQACQSISDGVGKSASALVQSPLKKYRRGASMGSALATAVQGAPAAAMAPAAATARAVHCALLGVRNSLDPEHRRESVEKYLGRSPPQ